MKRPILAPIAAALLFACASSPILRESGSMSTSDPENVTKIFVYSVSAMRVIVETEKDLPRNYGIEALRRAIRGPNRPESENWI